MGIWKLLSAIFVTIILFVVIPYVLVWANLTAPIKEKAWIILLVTTVGLIFKTIFGDIVSGNFQYHKHGYDFCIITLGAALSSFSLQLTSENDLFPNLPTIGPWSILAAVTPNTLDQRRILLFLVFLFSCLGSLLTAYIVRAIAVPSTKFKNVLCLINFVIGTALLGFYVLMLTTKG